ncbi:hypothetical protein [Streptomyces jeddahensis]|uniref:Uncharacterized protein n=1 Tax=Streptomyces jeddahensis TaxID=1716141 RepID=A0A177HUS4_9ACTN|nr:hypothetical protein [Streptomyces jeddahensis]OAH14721.1 hypothetical protein STSP_19830 [Streptomyces jeddahensis]
MAGRIVRWAPALGLGALWWWAVLRLTLVPDAGALEAAVAVGGWGLSLLPVHCVPKSRATRVVGAVHLLARLKRRQPRHRGPRPAGSGGPGS